MINRRGNDVSIARTALRLNFLSGKYVNVGGSVASEDQEVGFVGGDVGLITKARRREDGW